MIQQEGSIFGVFRFGLFMLFPPIICIVKYSVLTEAQLFIPNFLIVVFVVVVVLRLFVLVIIDVWLSQGIALNLGYMGHLIYHPTSLILDKPL